VYRIEMSEHIRYQVQETSTSQRDNEWNKLI
jgi:hypothetical protein